MKKVFKNRIFIIFTVMVLVIAVLAVCIFAANGSFSKTVEVYKASEMALDWWGAGTTATGKVTAGKKQSITLSSDDKVAEIYVSKGDTVKKGDKLFKYDISEIESQIKSREVEVESAENAVYVAKAELQAMKKATPGVGAIEDANDATLNMVVSTDMIPYAGDGSKENPYRFNLASGAMLGSDYINALTEERDEDLYQLLEYHSNNDINGELLYEIRLVFYSEGTFDFSVAQFDLAGDTITTDYSKYTQDELDDLIENKENEIKSLTADKSIAQANLAAVQSKSENSVVYAAFAGTVTTLRSASSAAESGKAFMEILSDGGLYISGTVNEFELGNVKPGTSVEILSLADSKVLGTAEITDISEYPDTSGGLSSESALSVANTNASYYPFTAAVDGSARVKAGDTVTVSFDKSNTSSVYILSAFVVGQDDGKSYVYAANSSGILEKQYVEVGSIIYGEYTEITSGITADSQLAFPYGKNVHAGAKTTLGSVAELLSGTA